MFQMYDESISKYKYSNPHNGVSGKNKKVKRGVKTSYGNYAQCQAPSPFMFNNKINIHKARKSLVANGNSKKTFYVNNSHVMDSFK